MVAGAHLTAVSVDKRGAAAVCDDEGQAIRIELHWEDPGTARCPCADFRRRGTCPHALALLEATLSALDEDEGIRALAARGNTLIAGTSAGKLIRC